LNSFKKVPTNPLKIQDNTFRDGHQSIYATRMKTEDMLPIAEEMDNCGFHAMEVWGGATFDTMHRFLGEDPWMRPRILKSISPKPPLPCLYADKISLVTVITPMMLSALLLIKLVKSA